MRTRHSNAAGLLFVATVLSGCDPGPAEGPRRGADVSLSGTSFAGEYHLPISQALSTTLQPPPFHRTFAHGSGAVDLSVELIVPAGIYAWPATFPCGTDPAGSVYAGRFCTITVWESGGSTSGEWTTWGVLGPTGELGALPDCSITVTEDLEMVRGSFACAGLRFRGVTTHPDAIRTLSLSGTFNVVR